jgi:TldD protein
MLHDRRDFLKVASFAGLSLAGRAMPGYGLLRALDLYPRAGDPLLRELSARALDTARAAGATYADVRFTLERFEDLIFFSHRHYQHLRDHEFAGVGVRALVDGAWGFASSPHWTPEEVARLAREAAAQARTNAQGQGRRIDLGPPPPAASGEWATPIRRDPFTVPMEEKVETAWAFLEQASRYNVGVRRANIGSGMRMNWRRQERTFASTDGAFTTQTIYQSDTSLSVGAQTPEGRAGRSTNLLGNVAGGWELFADAPLVDDIPRLAEEALEMVGAEPVRPDRYDVVMDARTVAQLVGMTIGTATELDRVLGYEANAGGTSYLAPPAEMLGSFEVGSGLLNVRADRSSPRGLASVRWDEEGVEPEDYDLVRDGVLVDYQTTRELAAELGNARESVGRLRSRGGAWSESGLDFTMLHSPNVQVLPGPEDRTFDDLVAGLERGLVICGGRVTVDRQQLNGEINGELVYEVRDGRRTRIVHSSEALFRSPELWRGLKALGGPGTQEWSGVSVQKGQPQQRSVFGAAAVPALFENVAVTDRRRKA